MSINIRESGTTATTINDMQLHAILTGNVKGATKLEGWEAFKNFFIKILNYLPGMSIEDKENKLRDIYDRIYCTGSSAGLAENSSAIEKTWNALGNLIQLIDAEKAHQMKFAVHSLPDESLIKLTVMINDHQIPDVYFSHSPLNVDILTCILSCYMESEDFGNGMEQETSGIFRLDRNALENNNSRVAFAPTTIAAFKTDIMIAKKLNECQISLQTDIAETTVKAQLKQLNQNQQLISELKELRSPAGVEMTPSDQRIDKSISALEQNRERLQNRFEKKNYSMVDLLLQNWSAKLKQSPVQPFNKAQFERDMVDLENTFSEAEDLYSKEDGNLIKNISSQWRLACSVVDLQERINNSKAFSQELITTMKALVERAKNESGPLSEAINHCLENIQQQPAGKSSVKSISAVLIEEAQHLKDNVLKNIVLYENKISHLSNNPEIDLTSEPELSELNKLHDRVNKLPPLVQGRDEIIQRAEAIYQQYMTWVSIEKRLKENSSLNDFDLFKLAQETELSKLQTHNDKLPPSQRKTDYQENINSLNIDLFTRKINIFEQHIRQLSQIGQSDKVQLPSDHGETMKKLIELNGDIQRQALPEENKSELATRIATLLGIQQNENIRKIEQKLTYLEKGELFALKSEIDELRELNARLMSSPQTENFPQRITSLNEKSINGINNAKNRLVQIESAVNNVCNFNEIFSSKLLADFAEVKKLLTQIPESSRIAFINPRLEKLQNTLNTLHSGEIVFAQAKVLLEGSRQALPEQSKMWGEALIQLRKNVDKLQVMPDSLAAKDLARRVGEDMLNALGLLGQLIKGNSGKSRDHMKKMEKDYIVIRDMVRAYPLLNADILEDKISTLKADNKFKSTAWIGKLRS